MFVVLTVEKYDDSCSDLSNTFYIQFVIIEVHLLVIPGGRIGFLYASLSMLLITMEPLSISLSYLKLLIPSDFC